MDYFIIVMVQMGWCVVAVIIGRMGLTRAALGRESMGWVEGESVWIKFG
jgi:hypothetical protein